MGISLQNIHLSVGNETYLENISLDFDPGATNILLGRTLSGKTSLLRIMAGLDRPDKGRIFVDGEDVTGVSVRKRNISMVYQQFINYPSFTIFDNIASPLKIIGMSKKDINRRVMEVAEMLHLETMLDRTPIELSGGQQQRCAIARALVKDAKLLLLDEPLVNLDYKLREELQTELQEIFRKKNAIVVYTTTEPGEALKLGGNIAVLHEGRLIQSGPTPHVYRNPANVSVAKIFSDPPINLLEGRVAQGKMTIGDTISFQLTSHLKTLTDGSYHVGIRSNHLYLNPQDEMDFEMDTTVELSELNGSETFIHVNYTGFKLVVQEVGIFPKKIDSRLNVYMNPSNLFVFDESGEMIISPEKETM